MNIGLPSKSRRHKRRSSCDNGNEVGSPACNRITLKALATALLALQIRIYEKAADST
jgi:hypothetical protein